MAHILMPLPARDFDPTEAAVPWRILTGLGHRISFTTPDGAPGQADDIMLTGAGLDPWGWLPGVRQVPLVGLLLRANRDARTAYARMIADAAFHAPLTWDQAAAQPFDGLLLPGGHRARGMRPYLESPVLQQMTVGFFKADKPVGAICHGVLLAARSIDPDTRRSVLHGRKTTALTWQLEKSAATLAKITRFWDPAYYRTYEEQAGQPAGYMSVEQEVTRALQAPADFLNVAEDMLDFSRKTSGLARDSEQDATPSWVVRDGQYVSARWPGDAHAFARTFATLLP